MNANAKRAIMAVDLQDLADTLPTGKLTREQLVRTHRSHLKKQDRAPDAPRPVKQPDMSEAYPPSTRSIRDLEIVRYEDDHNRTGEELTGVRKDTCQRSSGRISP